MDSLFLLLFISIGVLFVVLIISEVSRQNQVNGIHRSIDAANKQYELVSKNLENKRKLLEKEEARLAIVQEKLRIGNETLALEKKRAEAEKQLRSAASQLEKCSDTLRSIQYAVEQFSSLEYKGEALRTSDNFDLSIFKPMTQVELSCFQIKELRSLFRKNEKSIQSLLEYYKDKYSSKANAVIYQLMVLALESEFQLILKSMSFGNLDQSLDAVRNLTARYYSIASQGSQTIIPTLTKFIGQLEYYYLESVKIEYEYYVKRERAKEEQRALKEQMRQEAEERKLLEKQKKQVEAEESKYEKELQRITEKMQAANGAELDKLRQQLEKVQAQLDSVHDKKDEIVRLQNGKAGTVYVISNI